MERHTGTMPETVTKANKGFEKVARNSYVPVFSDDVYDKYDLVRMLGKGSMGFVAEVRIKDDKIGGSAFERTAGGCFGLPCCHRKERTGKLSSEGRSKDHAYALKSIIADRVSSAFIEEMRNEIEILRHLDHPFIVRVHEVYSYRVKIYMIIDLCEGGDLYTRCPYSERDAAMITAQILSAVKYLHSKKIIHRDLKFENIMFESKSENARIRLIDFGLSKKLRKGEMAKEKVGTLVTMSPQVLQKVYSTQADMWAVGVITFMLLSSSRPFYSKHRETIIDKIMRVEYSLDGPSWTDVSDPAKDFVGKLLVLEPKERMNASRALRHGWILNRRRLLTERPSAEVIAQTDGHLLKYAQTSDLKKLALNMIAHKSSPSEIKELRKVFRALDKDHDGIVTFAELQTALHSKGYSEEDIKDIFQSVDANNNGKIDFTEFLAATIEAQGTIAEDRIAVAFDKLDCDDTGYITAKNLMDILGEDCRKNEAKAIINEVTGGVEDGRISYEQFLDEFRSQIRKEADEMVEPSESASDASHELCTVHADIPGGQRKEGPKR